MTKQELDLLVDKMLERNRLAQEVDAVVTTCGVTDPLDKWHVFRFSDYLELLAAAGVRGHKNTSVQDDTYEARYEFKYRGLVIFCLRKHEEESVRRCCDD